MRSSTEGEPNWVQELQNLVNFKKILQSPKHDIKVCLHINPKKSLPDIFKESNFNFTASKIDSLIFTASSHGGESLNTTKLIPFLDDSQNLHTFFYRSSLYDRAGTYPQEAALTREDRQLSAKIHCLYGIPTTAAGRRALSAHAYARSRVYDLRNYTEANGWGPFRDDCSIHVDWEMVESLMVVLDYNYGLCCRRGVHKYRPPWLEPFEGVVLEKESIMPNYPLTLVNEIEIPLDMKDPYGVSGVYSRIVCFLGTFLL